MTEEEYQRWVRVLAVEVLRQTPLQDVRFLDIIGITRGEEMLRRGRSEECLTTIHCQPPETPTPATVVPRQKLHRNKYNFKEECKKKKEKTEFSQWLHCVKRETQEENVSKNTDFDMKNMKIRRAQRVRPQLPFADTWNKIRGNSGSGTGTLEMHGSNLRSRSVSMDDLLKRQRSSAPSLCTYMEEKKQVSDESGISSGDENNNTVSDASSKGESRPKKIFVSVREKKQFFESLSGENETKRVSVNLNRSNSIGNIDMGPQQPLLGRGQRASSMHDLSANALPVKTIRRLFENGSTNDMTKSFDELRFDDDARSTIVEEDEGNSENDGKKVSSQVKVDKASSTPFVNPLERKTNDTVCYANIQFCRYAESSVSTPTKYLGNINKRVTVKVKYPERFEVNDADQEIHRTNNLWNTRKHEKSKILSSRTEEWATAEETRLPELTKSQLKKEGNSAAKEEKVKPENGQSDMSMLLAQRKLQRGERKLGKLRIQIAEVEETIKHIAEDLHSIGPNTLKKRAGLEVFAALRRRLEEESSRLERLQEETAKVIADNQRTILKMGPIWPANNQKTGVLV